MARQMHMPAPFPTLDGLAQISNATVDRYLWGDEVSGRVADWIYVSNGETHQLVFGLPPGGTFRHSASDAVRTIFAADEVYQVLNSTLVLSNPQTGEVHRALPHEAAFFRRDTWHHASNHGSEALRVLEFIAPPPSQGTAEVYDRTKLNITEPKYAQDRWMGRWPMARPEAQSGHTIRVLREPDVLWRLDGPNQQALVGILVSTEHLTVGKVYLPPRKRTEVQVHGVIRACTCSTVP